MQKNLVLVGGIMLALTMAWASEDTPPEHSKLMKELGRQNGAIRKGADVEKNATEMQATVKQLAAFWKARNVEDAVKSCDDNIKGAEAVAVAAKANNADGVAAGMKMIGGSCKSCHDAHREKVGPDEYKIK
jgi:mono/diheme cytochrome c family protein